MSSCLAKGRPRTTISPNALVSIGQGHCGMQGGHPTAVNISPADLMSALFSSLSVSHYHGQLVPLSESSPCWRGTRHSGTTPLDFLLQALFVLYYKGDSTSHPECYFKPEHHIRPTPCYLPGASYTPITTPLPPFSQCYSHHGTRLVTNSQLPPSSHFTATPGLEDQAHQAQHV